jgi:Uma2 family endonuclease
MGAVPRQKLPEQLTVDEYLAWAEGRPGRYELYAGTVYAMAPQRAGHARVKAATYVALREAITRANVPCMVLPDGMTVRVAPDTAHEPDALVYCGERLPDNAIEVPNPVIVVEVLSPSTRHIDASAKLAGYFRLESVQHYLIIDPDKPPVIHHARSKGDNILTTIVNEGPIALDPPGITVAIEDFWQD